ncbi:MAG TPA: hypothetical protein VFA37_03855 [Gaiellaceae bacterium]|nr:hypothetical protein [Gaiellaceae bacterium]
MRRLAFVLAVLLLAAGTAWGAHNPNPPSCSDGGDRLTKLTLVEQLRHAPSILVLGSSRARVANPGTIRQLTGRSAFNAGVRGGGAADEYVFARVLGEKFPHARPAYLIFTDVGIAGDGVNPELADEPLARRFLGKDASSRKTTCVPNGFYTPEGGIAYSAGLDAQQRAARVAQGVAEALPKIDARGSTPVSINPATTTYFQRLLAFANKHGATPVIVLNPIYPTVLAEHLKYGFPEQKAADTYLAWLHKRYRFVVLNCEDIRTWGGTKSDFFNYDHLDRTNMSRMLGYIVAQERGILGRR